MASAKDLKKRIGTVQNTQQTTKAMKMVSAAKLRRAQMAIQANRPYASRVDRLIRVVSSNSKLKAVSSLINADKTFEPKRILLVGVTSDRGLCGGFNSNITRKIENWLKENQSKYESISYAFIGKKAKEYFKARGIEAKKYLEFGRGVQFKTASTFLDWLVDEYNNGSFDAVKVVYNEFKNAISQEIVVEHLLPIDPKNSHLSSDEASQKAIGDADLYLLKPSPSELLHELLKKHFAIQLYRILLESQASEHGARMAAMDNATNNAKEMIRSLTLQYNKQRQAGITGELMEIIAGSESQKS